MMQCRDSAAAGVSGMPAAATNTECSTRTISDGLWQQGSQSIGQQAAADGSVQILLSLLQKAQAADRIQQQQRATLSQQQTSTLAGISGDPGSDQRLLDGASATPQQLLQELACCLTQHGDPKTALAATAQALATQSLPQLQQQQHPGSPSGSPRPCGQLQHDENVDDSTPHEATLAEAALDLHFVARDAGSFTKQRSAALLARAAAVAAVRDQTPAPEVPEEPPEVPEHVVSTAAMQKAAPAAGNCRHRSDTTAPAAADAAAAGGHDGSALLHNAGRASQQPHDHLLAFLTEQLAKAQALHAADTSQQGPGVPAASQQQATPAAAGEAADAAIAAAAAAAAALPSHPEVTTGATEGSSGGGGAAASEALLPLLQRVQLLQQQQMALRQQSLTMSNASASTAAAVQASLLRQQSRQVPTSLPGVPAMLSGDSFQSDGLGRTMSSLTNFTSCSLAERLGLCPPPAAAKAVEPAGAAPQQQQQPAAAAAAAEGPYPSYLDADLLELYAEVKSTRKTVFTIVKEAVSLGLLTNQIQKLQQLRQQRAAGSFTFTSTAAATATAATASGMATSTGVHPSASQQLKRPRDQQEGHAAAWPACADIDAPSSKLRRTGARSGGPDQGDDTANTAADNAADTAAAAAAAAAQEPVDMDITEPAVAANALESQDQPQNATPAEPTASLPDALIAATAAPAAVALEGAALKEAPAAAAAAGAIPAATASEGAQPAAANPAAAAAPEAAPAGASNLASAAESPALLTRSVETVILLHSLTNKLLGKAVGARKEAGEAGSKAQQFAALTAASQNDTHQLQMQNHLLRQQLHLAQLQLRAKQQQVVQAQTLAQRSILERPQLVSQVATAVSNLVTLAHKESLPLVYRQELAVIAEDLLAVCSVHSGL